MLRLSSTNRVSFSLLPAILGILLSGCGELVSGANLKPTVRYKPSSTSDAAVESPASAGAAAEVAGAGGFGTLKGKVEFAGSFSTLPPLYQKGDDVKDKDVCGAADAPNESILVKDGGLANVFIYLRKAPKIPAVAAPASNIIFDQKYCVFKPHAMIMPVGQTIKVLNSDSIAHNTHTFGVKTVPFNEVVPPNEAVGKSLVYKQAEQMPIKVGCDIHPWMIAYHLPIDHPFAAVSAEDGTFEIKDLPAGKHELKVWHEAGGLLEKALIVTINPGENVLPIKVTPSQLGK